MSIYHRKAVFMLPAMLFAALMVSCANRGTAPADAPHATVTMRDGTQIAGTVTASSPSGITLLGDDRVSHTFSMSQVRSVDYDQGPPPVVDAGTTQSGTNTSDQFRSDDMHNEHYHPPQSAIRSTTYSLPAGALIPVRSEETIDAAIAAQGQTYAAEVTRDVTDAGGAVVSSGKASLDPKQRTQLRVGLKSLLSGTYKVNWRVLSVDTHRTQGDFTFRVGQ